MPDQPPRTAASDATIADLSEQLRVMTAERDDYRLVFDQAPLLIWYKDDQNNVLRANQPAAESAGLTPEEMVGRSAFDLYPEEAEGYYRDDLEVIRSGRPKLNIIERLDTPEGKRWIQTDKIPWSSTLGESGVLVFVSDITDRVQLQEELYRSQRLESIGILAGGIAHDFNNLLTSFYGNIEILRENLGYPVAGPSEDLAARYLRRATASITRARSLSLQLLTLAKGGEAGRQPVPLAPLIEEVAALALSGSAIQPDVLVAPDLPLCLGDREQIAQVLENLLLNAVQAVDEANARAEPGRPRRPGLCRVQAGVSRDPLPTHSGPWIEITVADNGVGIDAASLDRIFDPFYTTKATGSGLGLASAHSIAERHGGVLDCRSSAEGSTFRLLLPIADGPEESKREDRVPLDLDGLRVLVLDDDAAIREFIDSASSSLRLELACVSELSHALAACQQAIDESRPFDLAVIDLTVRGGAGGEDALTALKTLQPDLRSMVWSGYTDDAALVRPEAHGFDAGLAKPFLLSELRAALGKAIRRT